MKHPSERRPGLPQVNRWVFWPQFIWETLRKQAISIGALFTLVRVMRAIQRDPNASSYSDQALKPVHDDEATLDLLTKTSGAQAAVAHAKRVEQLVHADQVA
jgi:hypothetical protein